MDAVAQWQREHWERIEGLFYAALELDAAARPGFLRQTCGADAQLLREVESLLQSSEKTVAFARGAVAEAVGQGAAIAQPPGKRIGAYEVIRVLGKGGMGTVYLARRADQSYQQEVAIKLMHPGFGPTQRMLLRFSAERQILANLNHPNISLLLDGGLTEEGLPYLVMEYVNGVRIDEYCRQNRISVEDRLNLFRMVCSAVEFAHKNLVIHRDIKPGNILVTPEGVPKLLDFGIAKLLDSEAREFTLTQTGDRLMTPEYASPEQMLGGQITTATDVYALGILLYELLAGKKPFDIQTKSPLEAAQVICEQTPQPPSRVIRGLEGADAERKLRGDLDLIVLMAMRKEPSRRYSSVGALSRDVQDYLTGYPVRARTDTWRYRTGKYVRRHKLGVLTASLALLALIGFSTGMGLLARRATEERRIADEQRQAAQREADFLAGIFNATTPDGSKGSEITARELLDQSAKRIDSELKTTPDEQAPLLYQLGVAYTQLGLYDQAQPLLKRSYVIRRKLLGDGSFIVAKTAQALAHTYRMGGHYAEAEVLFRQALQTAQKAPPDDTSTIAKMVTDLAFCLYSESQDSEAESLFRKSLVLNPEPDNRDGAMTRSLLAQVLDRKGDLSGAWQFGNEAVAILERVEGPTFNLAVAQHILAGIYRDSGNLEKAESVEREALALWRKTGGGHVDVAYSIDNLGVILLDEGDWKQAEPLLKEALSIRQKQLGAAHPLLGTSLLDWGRVLQAKGDNKGAEAYFHQALDMERETVGPRNWRLKSVLDNLALLQLDEGDFNGAEGYAGQALDMGRELGGERHPEVASSLTEVALPRELQGDAAGAEPMLREALNIRKSLFALGNPDVIAAETRLGEALIAEGKPQLAEPVLREAVNSVHSEPFLLLAWQIAEPENALGVCLVKLGHTSEARPLLQHSRGPLKSYPELALRNWMVHLGGERALAASGLAGYSAQGLQTASHGSM
jgi:tetratricopeptide (TPR) repeat protein